MATVTDANEQPPPTAVPEGVTPASGGEPPTPVEGTATTPAQGAEAPVGDAPDAPAARRSWLRRRSRRIDTGEPQSPPDPASTEQTGVIQVPVSPDEGTTVIPPVQPPTPPKPPKRPSAAKLRRERAGLMAQREEMIFHLGGLAFELYRHDLLSHEVARLRAGRVAELDQAVHEIDRQLMQPPDRHQVALLDAAPAEAGCCLACRAVFFADARFCMQCGSRLLPPPLAGEGPSDAPPAAGASDTRVIPTVAS